MLLDECELQGVVSMPSGVFKPYAGVSTAVIARWKTRDPKASTDRTAKAFFVPATEIRDNKYDLVINRCKEVKHEEVHYDPPKVILAKLRTLETQIRKDLDELEGILG